MVRLKCAAVLCGMGASGGTVSQVQLAGSFPREDIFCSVIGWKESKGICGSGLERISHIGNCAGTGSSMALLSAQAAREMEQDVQMIQHVELADEEGFQACFLESLRL